MNRYASWRRSWGTALRVARREALRAKWRSTLVIAMIGLPVMLLAFAAASYDMFTLHGDEKARQKLGAADALVRWDRELPVIQNADASSYGITSDSPVVIGGHGEPPAPFEPTKVDVLTHFPAGTEAIAMRTGSVLLRTVAGQGDIPAVAVDALDPLTYGMVEILSGRAPKAGNEVALSTAAVRRLGTSVGGTVSSPDGKRSYSVVGLAEMPGNLGEMVLFAPIEQRHSEGIGLDMQWLLRTPAPVTWADVRTLNELGMLVVSRSVLINPPPHADQEVITSTIADVSPTQLAAGVLVSGMALLEVVLVAGPAFAVSVRRRQRQLALVAANGGTQAQVRRIVLADGVVLGLAGAAAGVLLGIAGAFLGRPFIEELLAHYRAGAYRVFPLALLAVAGLAVLIGTLAAAIPAIIVARQDVVASLAGRRGLRRSRRRWLVLGLTMIAVALAVTTYGAVRVSANIMLAGMIIGELGAVACTPTLIGLVARLGRFLPLMPRIALRDAARNRAAATPAIAAVMAAVAGSVAIGLYLNSTAARDAAEHQAIAPMGNALIYLNSVQPTDSPAQALAKQQPIRQAVLETFPVEHAFVVSYPGCADRSNPDLSCSLHVAMPEDRKCPYLEHYGMSGPEAKAAQADPRCRDVRGGLGSRLSVVIDDGSALAALTGASGDDLAEAIATLRAGGIVVPTAQYVVDGRATVGVEIFDFMKIKSRGLSFEQAAEPIQSMRVPAHVLTTGIRSSVAIMSPATLASTGLAAVPIQLVVDTSRMPTQAEEDHLRARLGDATGFQVEKGPPGDIDPMLWVLAGAAAVIALGATAISTALAASDSRADLSTLASVGASPAMRRGLSLSQSGIIAGFGSLLGAAAGLGVAAAVIVALNARYADQWPAPHPLPITLPWLSLAVAMLIVPGVAMAGAGLLTRSRLPIERRL